MRQTIYERFIEEMEKNGFRKVHSYIDEIYTKLSDDDEIVSITAIDCHMVTIKGLKESLRGNEGNTPPHRIFMKVYSEDGKELGHNDTIQFSIINIERKGLPTVDNNTHCCVYYHYPYGSISSKKGIVFKKGIAITKDKRLEIRILRNSKQLKVGKYELNLECDKWYKIKKEIKFDLTENSKEFVI